MNHQWLKEELPKKHTVCFFNEAAKDILGITSATWRWKSSEVVDEKRRGSGFIIVGSETRPLKSGPRKGQLTWIGPEQRCIVTEEHLRRQEHNFECNTGDCSACYGLGKRVVGVCAKRGTAYECCDRCKGSGKATFKPIPIS